MTPRRFEPIKSDTQPRERIFLNRRHPLAQGLIYSAYNSALDVGLAPYNYVDGSRGVLSGTSRTVSQLAGNRQPVLAQTYGGTSADAVSHQLNLWPYKRLTVMFWLWWNSFANDDRNAVRYADTTAAKTGFIVNPNWSSALFEIATFSNGGFSIYQASRPSAGVWHHYVFELDLTLAAGQAGVGLWIDAAPAGITAAQNSQSAGATFTSGGSLYLMQNPNVGNFSSGRLMVVNIWSRLLFGSEIDAHYLNPWAMFVRPVREAYWPSGGPSPAARASDWFFGG